MYHFVPPTLIYRFIALGKRRGPDFGRNVIVAIFHMPESGGDIICCKVFIEGKLDPVLR
jgi:hypothetical protein